MTLNSHRPLSLPLISGTLLSLLYLTSPTAVLAGGGHGHGSEFQDGSGANVEATSVVVDKETAKGLQIKTQPVQSQRLAVGIKTTGQVEVLPNRQVEVTNPVTGTVVELLVKPGDFVEFGKPVAVMNSPELVELRVNAQEQRAVAQSELKQAQANLRLAQENYDRTKSIFKVASIPTNVKLASTDSSLFQSNSVLAVAKDNYERQKQISQAEIESANIELSVAQEQYERDQELADKGAIPKRQMRESQAKYAAAQAKLTQAKSSSGLLQAEGELKKAELDFRKELTVAENEVNRAQSAVEVAQAKLSLSDSAYKTRLVQLQTSANNKGLVTILAPISGRVAERAVTLGQSFEDAGGKLMTIVNDSRVLVSANVYEKDLGRVKVGQVVRATVSGLNNETFSGIVSIIGSTVQGESRVIAVKAELNNPRGQLKPGMFANLEILTNENTTEILAIPLSAIVEANNKNLVYVENGNAYQAVEVTLGETYRDLVEVKTGLFEGDVIVTQRAPQLYAQGLKGGGTEEHSDEDSEEATTEETTETTVNQSTFSWWILIATGGILAGGMFWAGSMYGNRRQKGAVIMDTVANTPNGVNLDSHSSKPLKSVDTESLENPEKH